MKISTAYNHLTKLATAFTVEHMAETVGSVAFFGLVHNQVRIKVLNKLRTQGINNSSIKTLLVLVNKFTPIKWDKTKDSYVFDVKKSEKIAENFNFGLDSLTQESLVKIILDSMTDKPETVPKFSALTETWAKTRMDKFTELATADQQFDEIKAVKAYLQAIEREHATKLQGIEDKITF